MELKKAYQRLTAFEFDIMSKINNTYDVGFKMRWCDIQKEYCVDEEPNLEQSGEMLYFLDQYIKKGFGSLIKIKNELDDKHQCLRR